METVISALDTALGIFVALALWFLFMSFVRRRSGCRGDKDVLEFMTHGCAGCKGDGACSKNKSEREHRELT